MSDTVNILILSCGTRNKIVQYFKKELCGKGVVVATDCSKFAPALYEADKHYIVPKISEEGYIDVIFNICKENNIKAVLSLIDPELNLLATYNHEFLKIGTTPIVSNREIIEICFNKYCFYEYLLINGFKTVKSYVDLNTFYRDLEEGTISFPVFVKPVRGSASININRVTTKDEIVLLFERYNDLIIQEFMDGIEYGVDVYVDMLLKDPVAIFIKEKIMMRAGETDKSVSVKDEKLFDLVKRFVKKAGLIGILDIDIFKVCDEYYISEVNPRFGGGYPHAYECGVNVPGMIVKNIKGIKNKDVTGQYEKGVCMMKYNEIIILRD